MATLIDLPLDVLEYIFSFLDFDELADICFTCKKIYDICQLRLNSVWVNQEAQEDAKIEFKSPTDLRKYIGAEAAAREETVLSKYGSLLGLWQLETKPYSGLLQIKFIDGILLATLLLGPVTASEPLREKTLFSIELQDDGSFVCYCQVQSKQRHRCQLGEIFENSFSSKCTDPTLHIHPGGKEQEFADWLFEETCKTPDSEFLCGQDLLVMKFVIIDQYKNSFTYKRIDYPKNLSTAIIQPGLFKGNYGTHGVELIMLSYEENGMEMKGTKITGDFDVPANQISIRADLRYSIAITDEEQVSIDKLMKLIPVIKEEPLDKLSQQAYAVPNHCLVLDHGRNMPTVCRARFHGEGQLAFHGYTEEFFAAGHWMVYDENTFGFLWLKLKLLIMYSRVTEKLD